MNTKLIFAYLGLFLLLFAECSFAGILTDNSDGTVSDNATLLMWQQAEGGAMTWSSALTYCEGLSLGGYNNWRLPNYKEIMSLFDDSKSVEPAINTKVFPNAQLWYWSSTTYINQKSAAHTAYFGIVTYGSAATKSLGNIYVRCVRGGQ